jgi:hypothetical protein
MNNFEFYENQFRCTNFLTPYVAKGYAIKPFQITLYIHINYTNDVLNVDYFSHGNNFINKNVSTLNYFPYYKLFTCE